MPFSTQSKLLFSCVFLGLAGCATSSYKVAKTAGRRVELAVTSDRVILECELASENREVPYGFMIHVLDNEKTVLDVVQTNTLDKKSCFERIEKIGKILQTGNRIYIAGYGDISDPRTVEQWQHTFPRLGTFNANGRMLQFSAIANEQGSCYSAQFRDEKPCPRDEFPIGD